MKLKKKHNAIRLLRLFNAGLISADEYKNLVSKSKKQRFNSHLMWSLLEYAELSKCKNDIELISTALKIEKTSLSKIKRVFFNTKVQNLTVEQYLSTLRFVRDGIQDISEALNGISFPPMSAEKIQAGFNTLNFGELGLARTIAEFERTSTEQANDYPMHFIIKSLSQLAALKWCEHVHSNILTSKSKTK